MSGNFCKLKARSSIPELNALRINLKLYGEKPSDDHQMIYVSSANHRKSLAGIPYLHQVSTTLKKGI